MNQASGQGAHRWARHRRLNIEKVENGYKITARFWSPGEDDTWEKAKDLDFVFALATDVTAFVAEYLNAPGADLVPGWPDEIEKQ